MLYAGSGSPLRLPRLCSFLSVQLGLDLRMRNGQKTFHKIRELAEIALNILGGVGRASWLLRHEGISVPCRNAEVNSPCLVSVW
jgi:hypothetical protein